eukprot:scaffold2693_cov241-Pinguiococcus_pyrenoidosus.AAC.1
MIWKRTPSMSHFSFGFDDVMPETWQLIPRPVAEIPSPAPLLLMKSPKRELALTLKLGQSTPATRFKAPPN